MGGLYFWFYQAGNHHYSKLITYTIAGGLMLLMFSGTYLLYFKCFKKCFIRISERSLIFAEKGGEETGFLTLDAQAIALVALRTEKDAIVYFFTVKTPKNKGLIFRIQNSKTESILFKETFIKAFPEVEIIEE